MDKTKEEIVKEMQLVVAQMKQDDIEDKLHNTELSLFKNSYDYEERNK